MIGRPKKYAFSSYAFSSGQTLVLFPILIGLLGTLLAGLSVLTLLAQRKSEVQILCQKSLLELQSHITKGMNQLLDLNPKAQALRLEYEAAAAEVVATAPFPPAHVAAQAHLNSVIVRQLLLNGRQNSILLKSNLLLQNAHLKTRLNFISAKTHPQVSGARTLTVRTTPKGSLSPDRLPSEQFEQRHLVRLSWRQNTKEVLPHWLEKWIPFHHQLTGECSASPRSFTGSFFSSNGGARWVPTLREGKP